MHENENNKCLKIAKKNNQSFPQIQFYHRCHHLSFSCLSTIFMVCEVDKSFLKYLYIVSTGKLCVGYFGSLDLDIHCEHNCIWGSIFILFISVPPPLIKTPFNPWLGNNTRRDIKLRLTNLHFLIKHCSRYTQYIISQLC